MFSIYESYIALQIAVFVGFVLLVLFLRSRNASEPRFRSTPNPPNAATRQVCATLTADFPDITYTRQHGALWQCVESYWAAQAQVPIPALVVKPSSVSQVSSVVKVLTKAVKSSSHEEPVQFAIRSGGHSPVEGFASVDAGIVIDLGLFTAIELSADHKTVTIEPGANWRMVYLELEKHGLAVAGGRASSVGVGGLTLGGGLCFFSPQVGFVCDAIVGFEVVLADGSIVNASSTSHSDLAVALRGGGNNFGIVTKLVARTFPHTKVWQGYIFHRPSATQRLIQTYYDFGKADGFDQKASCMFIFSWAPFLPFPLTISYPSYAEPTPHPPSLQRFTKEKRFWSTMGVRTLAAAADVVQDMTPNYKQDLFHTTTFENDLETLHCAHAAYKDSLSAIKKVSGINWSLVFQPLVPSATLYHASNSMGINTNKTLTVMHVSVVWNYSKDNSTVHKAAEDLVDRVEAFAHQRGVYHHYKYANYCSASQNPYPGYGPERHNFLKEVSQKYDPNGIFQKGVPGGHKLWT